MGTTVLRFGSIYEGTPRLDRAKEKKNSPLPERIRSGHPAASAAVSFENWS